MVLVELVVIRRLDRSDQLAQITLVGQINKISRFVVNQRRSLNFGLGLSFVFAAVGAAGFGVFGFFVAGRVQAFVFFVARVEFCFGLGLRLLFSAPFRLYALMGETEFALAVFELHVLLKLARAAVHAHDFERVVGEVAVHAEPHFDAAGADWFEHVAARLWLGWFVGLGYVEARFGVYLGLLGAADVADFDVGFVFAEADEACPF